MADLRKVHIDLENCRNAAALVGLGGVATVILLAGGPQRLWDYLKVQVECAGLHLRVPDSFASFVGTLINDQNASHARQDKKNKRSGTQVPRSFDGPRPNTTSGRFFPWRFTPSNSKTTKANIYD
eukprot:228049-Amorphochlora_amoeboformis.AAC.2